MDNKTKFRKILIFLIISIFLLLVINLILFYLLSKSDNLSGIESIMTTKKYPRLLDGVLVDNQDKTKLKPVAIIIDNHFKSWPLVGLEKASIVYETIAESDVTRYLAIFDQDFEAEKIGPVRSARPYFVNWAEEWNSVLYHTGGSPAALAQLKQSSMWNLDEISANGIYYWRDENRDKPHNLYISAELIRQSLKDKNIDLEADFIPWLFKNDITEELRPQIISNINVDFSVPEYLVTYKYDLEKNSYQRFLAGQPHLTSGKKQIWAKNIVLLYTESKVLDRLGRLMVDTEIGGKARVYQDGGFIEAVWEKFDGRTRFFNQENGKEIKFNRGPIWIEVLFSQDKEEKIKPGVIPKPY